jgi:hypothetical protein
MGETGEDSFEKNFSSSSVVKDQAASIIIENIPTSFSPEALGKFAKIERDSELPTNSILSVRWIKPLHRRTADQRTVHAIARLNSPEAANRAIREGVIIAGRRSWARKTKKEPRRCLKCQILDANHFAADCQNQEVCGTCGQEHRTTACTEKDQTKFRCINCNESGHASWDQLCPRFVEKSCKLENANLKSSYRFFPCEEAWTWEQQTTKHGEEQNATPGGLANGSTETEQNCGGDTHEKRQDRPPPSLNRDGVCPRIPHNPHNPNPPIGSAIKAGTKHIDDNPR